MSLARALSRPPRCVLVNTTTGEDIECLFNPSSLAEKVDIKWNRLEIPGLSHQVLQYQNTGNRQLSGVEFYLDRRFASEQPGDIDILAFRGFLRSLTVPPAHTESVAATAPPRVLFVWPRVITIECVLSSVEFRYQQFAADGRILVYTANVGFEQILDTRVVSEQLREGREEPGY